MEKFELEVKDTQAKYKYIENTKNQQSSYNLPRDFFNYILDNNIIIESSKEANDNKHYKLTNDYKLKLSSTLKSLINIYNDENKFICMLAASNHKPQLKRGDYYKQSIEAPEYEWFVKLYDSNIAHNIIIFMVDEDNKQLIIDIKIPDSEKSPLEINPLVEEYGNILKYDITKPHNRIIYGAPGTGKSYKLNKEVKGFKRKLVELIEEDEKRIPTYWLGTCGENNYMFEEFKDKDIFAIGWDALGDPRKFDSIEILNSELIKIYPSISENNKTFNYFSYIKTMKKGDIILIRKGISLEIQGYGEVVEEYDYKPDLIKSYPNTVKVNWKKTSPQILEGYSGKQLTRNTLIPSPTEIISILNEKQYFEEKIKTKEKTISTIDRVTFYDGYTHGQFVGTYKPVPEGDSITYKYIPGPFMKQLVESYKNPTHNFCLIIEEINRAKADKVFGNIFQLLDRDNDGKSEYNIAVSADQEIYLKKELEDEYDEILKDLLDKGLYIPKNLYIWATMNSADQGVYPMDSAFKRRWHFEHIGLDQNEDEFGDKDKTYELTYQKKSETEGAENKNILWNNFRKIINDNLLRDNVSEDRLLAPFFIKENNFKLKEEKNYELDEKVFKNKILMYLFDDVLRHKRKTILFDENIESFSKLKSKYKNGENIFKSDLFSTEG